MEIVSTSDLLTTDPKPVSSLQTVQSGEAALEAGSSQMDQQNVNMEAAVTALKASLDSPAGQLIDLLA